MITHCQFPTKTTDLIKTYNIIPDDRVDQMLSWFHAVEDRHIDGSVGEGNDQGVDYGTKIAKAATPTPKEPIFQWISEITHDTYSRYINDCPGPVQDLVFHDYSVRVYPQNKGKFECHFDQYAGGCVTRLFAVIMYLNTVDEGGETEFPNYGIACKPEKGKVLIFPCNYLFPHQGNVPISHPKYIATSWIHWAFLGDKV